MKKQKIYLDTSIFGGIFDEEFSEFTKPLFKRIKNNEFELIYSDITEEELKNAPEKIRLATHDLPKNSTNYVKSDIEAANLANKYIEEKVVGFTSYTDCLHIALATVHNADILLSWNFKHIVNVVRIIGYNAVNLSQGYKQIDIRSPRELMKYEN